MKKWVIWALLFAAGTVFAADPRLDAVLGQMDFTPSERDAIAAIFKDADEKGLDREELFGILKELRLKGSSFYETVEYLARKEKEIYEVKKSAFPYQENRNMKYVAYYLAGMYSAKQFNGLTALILEQKMQTNEIQGLFQFHLALGSYGVAANDSYSILYYCLKNGYTGRQDLDNISGLYLRSRDLRLDRNLITKHLIAGLTGKKDIKNIVYEIKKKAVRR